MDRPDLSEALVGWRRLEAAGLDSSSIAQSTPYSSPSPGIPARVTTLRGSGGVHGDSIDEVDSEDEELAAFLAADYEPVEADPEFKRKLRDQLWSLIQSDEMTRQ